MYHDSAVAGDTDPPEDGYLHLDTNVAYQDGDAVWMDTAPSSTLVTLGDSSYVNRGIGAGEDASTYIAYFFSQIEGMQSFGGYVGNNSTGGGLGNSFGISDNTAGTAYRLIINSSGNVGIGTTTPASPLGANFKSLDINSGVWGGTINFSGNSAGYIGNRHSGNTGLGYYAVSGQGHSFAVNGSTTAAVTISSGGVLAVGTTNTRYNLSVRGTNATAVGIALDNDSGGATPISYTHLTLPTTPYV